jgi:hypothetical protein
MWPWWPTYPITNNYPFTLHAALNSPISTQYSQCTMQHGKKFPPHNKNPQLQPPYVNRKSYSKWFETWPPDLTQALLKCCHLNKNGQIKSVVELFQVCFRFFFDVQFCQMYCKCTYFRLISTQSYKYKNFTQTTFFWINFKAEVDSNCIK